MTGKVFDEFIRGHLWLRRDGKALGTRTFWSTPRRDGRRWVTNCAFTISDAPIFTTHGPRSMSSPPNAGDHTLRRFTLVSPRCLAIDSGMPPATELSRSVRLQFPPMDYG